MFRTGNRFRDALHWYQKKIGSYDQPVWEKSIEERVLRGLNHAIPKKIARVKKESIDLDLDLIRGSYFAKAKPQQSWLTITYLGMFRVFLLPLYLKWWVDQTNSLICGLLVILYFLQMLSMYLYFNLEKDFENVPVSEVVSPLFMFVILGMIQSQISASSCSKTRSLRSRMSPPFNVAKKTVAHPVFSTVAASNCSLRKKKSTSRKRVAFSSKISDDESGLDSLEAHDSHYTEEQLKSSKLEPSESNVDISDTGQVQGSYGKDDLFPRSQHLAPSIITRLKNASEGSLVEDKSVNSETGPDETIGDLSSADECWTYSTVDSNSFGEILHSQTFTTKSSGSCKPNSLPGSDFPKKSKGTKKCLLKTNRAYYRMSRSKKKECSSSGDSERSLSPSSPITKLASDIDWASINSDGSTEEDGEAGVAEESPEITNYDYLNLADEKSYADDCNPTISFNDEGFYCQRSGKALNDKVSCAIWRIKDHQKLYPCATKISTGSLEKNGSINQAHQISKNNETPVETVDRTVDHQYVCEYKKMHKMFKYFHFNRKIFCFMFNFVTIFNGNYLIISSVHKVELSVLDISSAIIRKVETVKHSNEYFYLGFIFSLILAFIPVIFRIRQLALSPNFVSSKQKVTKTAFFVNGTRELGEIIQEIPTLATDLFVEAITLTFSSWHIQFVVTVAIIERFFLSLCFFFLLCVAERTFRERFLYSKYFCHLTSSRRARRSDLPHFRLNKVRNIKTWLSVRSYLQNHGPQRSIDAIVSSSFILEISILTFLCIQLLRESEICSEKLYCWEMVFWNLAIGLYIMRLIILGSKMNRKSRGCLTILLSEQINLYLQLEQKPHKKEDLTLANQLIKSAADVLKLLEAPFKISGFSANPYLYNITKVIVLSAFSAVLTELLGFKLKLYKIKLAP